VTPVFWPPQAVRIASILAFIAKDPPRKTQDER
jgi:hypothetical protein